MSERKSMTKSIDNNSINNNSSTNDSSNETHGNNNHTSKGKKEQEMKSLSTHFNQINYRIINELGRLRSTFSSERLIENAKDEQGDVPGWVLVVLMTTGLVTAIWTIAAPRLQQILKNSLDSMSDIR